MTTPKPLRIFCSYSHEDEEHLNELRTCLRGLERQGLIEWWHDREIVPSWEWEEAIDKNLRIADVILLLVSHDFMGSDYVFEKEIAWAIERHEQGEARVIPIIVRPTDWEWAPFGKLQALPKDAKPITTWTNRDEAWLDVVRGIRKAVEKLTSKPSGDEPTGELGPLRYREGVELAWADEEIDTREVEWLRDLANRIGLSPSTAAEIEREVMGDTKEALVERRKLAPRPPEELLPEPAGSWWALALRGLVMGIFGLVLLLSYTAVFYPGTGDFRLYSAIVMIADGVFVTIDATTRPGRGRPLLIQGGISGLLGLFTFLTWLRYEINELVPAYYLVGSWAIIIGIIRIIAVFQLGREIKNVLLIGTSGVLLAVFGTYLVWPTSQFWWRLAGLLALASGITLIAFALRVRNQEKRGARLTWRQI